MRAACLATIFSSTDPIHLRSSSPSISFGLINQIARSLPLAHLHSGAGTYFCCEADDATGRKRCPPMTMPCCKALRTLAMGPTSGRSESACLV